MRPLRGGDLFGLGVPGLHELLDGDVPNQLRLYWLYQLRCGLFPRRYRVNFSCRLYYLCCWNLFGSGGGDLFELLLG